MSESGDSRPAFKLKTAELVVAGLFLALGLIVIFDSLRLGIGWEEVSGPRPGYFPFYIGLIVLVSALVNLVRGLLIGAEKNTTFVEVGQLKAVLTVLVPTAVFAALVGWIGVYASSVLYMGFFMRRLGKYAWWKVAAVSLGTVVVLFLVFELWFKVPLPKGPIEAALGLD